MMSFFATTSGHTLYIEDEEFRLLPARVREAIVAAAKSSTKEKEHIVFVIEDWDVAHSIQRQVTKIEKQRVSREHRRYSERTYSAGMYERSDIEEIFVAQEGKCFFTGEPLSTVDKNYSIDHILPIESGGSSWPGNLALVLKIVNQEKHGHGVRKYWSMLEERHGKKWVKARQLVCKQVGARRRAIDRKRRAAVKEEILQIEERLQERFAEQFVTYSRDEGELILSTDGVSVVFPVGFMRDGRKFRSLPYLTGIVTAILASGHEKKREALPTTTRTRGGTEGL
jgi:HNH endonuclease